MLQLVAVVSRRQVLLSEKKFTGHLDGSGISEYLALSFQSLWMSEITRSQPRVFRMWCQGIVVLTSISVGTWKAILRVTFPFWNKGLTRNKERKRETSRYVPRRWLDREFPARPSPSDNLKEAEPIQQNFDTMMDRLTNHTLNLVVWRKASNN